MLTLFSNNFLARKPIDEAMKKFAKNFSKDQKVLDIGCGNKPYQKYFSCNYIGLDPYKETKADVIADAWNTPFKDNEFDGIVLNQSLEHIQKTDETIAEIKRILKPGGVAIVTVPQSMRNHSSPIDSSLAGINNFDKKKIKYWNVDFYRYTKFGLIYLFRDFKIEELKELSGYIGTITQLTNYFLASFQPIEKIFFPFYLFLNIIGYFFDRLFYFLTKFNSDLYNKFYEIIYLSLTLNYLLIIKKDD